MGVLRPTWLRLISQLIGSWKSSFKSGANSRQDTELTKLSRKIKVKKNKWRFVETAPVTMSQWDVAFWGTSEQQTSSSSFSFPFPFYRIHLKGYSGTAGKISSIGQPGSDFSTKDADNDKCVCKCSQLTTGGKRNKAPPSESVARSRRSVRSQWRGLAMAHGTISHPVKILARPEGEKKKIFKGILSAGRNFVAWSKSTISSELITDQLSWEFGPYNAWH